MYEPESYGSEPQNNDAVLSQQIVDRSQMNMFEVNDVYRQSYASLYENIVNANRTAYNIVDPAVSNSQSNLELDRLVNTLVAEERNFDITVDDDDATIDVLPNNVVVDDPQPTVKSPMSEHASPVKKRHLNQNDYGDDVSDEEGRLCPICLDTWTNVGDHRVCSLNCGHLFGFSCVSRWLESQPKKCCPICKKVHRNAIRNIYARKVVAMDATELVAVKNELEVVKQEKNR